MHSHPEASDHVLYGLCVLGFKAVCAESFYLHRSHFKHMCLIRINFSTFTFPFGAKEIAQMMEYLPTVHKTKP